MLLTNYNDRNFACLLGILKGQGEFAAIGANRSSYLALSEPWFNLSDRVLSHYFFASETLCKVEEFDGLGEDDDNPVTKYV